MRKELNLGYGQKSVVVIRGNRKKMVTFKTNMGGISSVVVSRYTKGEVFGWDMYSRYSTILN